MEERTNVGDTSSVLGGAGGVWPAVSVARTVIVVVETPVGTVPTRLYGVLVVVAATTLSMMSSTFDTPLSSDAVAETFTWPPPKRMPLEGSWIVKLTVGGSSRNTLIVTAAEVVELPAR